MTAAKDKRKNNGAPNRGLTESSVLVTATAELVEAMQAIAQKEGTSVRAVWRRAAETYLRKHPL